MLAPIAKSKGQLNRHQSLAFRQEGKLKEPQLMQSLGAMISIRPSTFPDEVVQTIINGLG